MLELKLPRNIFLYTGFGRTPVPYLAIDFVRWGLGRKLTGCEAYWLTFSYMREENCGRSRLANHDGVFLPMQGLHNGIPLSPSPLHNGPSFGGSLAGIPAAWCQISHCVDTNLSLAVLTNFRTKFILAFYVVSEIASDRGIGLLDISMCKNSVHWWAQF